MLHIDLTDSNCLRCKQKWKSHEDHMHNNTVQNATTDNCIDNMKSLKACGYSFIIFKCCFEYVDIYTNTLNC